MQKHNGLNKAKHLCAKPFNTKEFKLYLTDFHISFTLSLSYLGSWRYDEFISKYNLALTDFTHVRTFKHAHDSHAHIYTP